jgi:voltage-gated potassium channel Kch
MIKKNVLKKLNFPAYIFQAIHTFISKNKGRTFRQKVFSLLNPTPTSGNLHHIVDDLIVISVLFSVISIILETVSWIHAPFQKEFYVIELFTVTVFSVEYIGRVYSCCEDARYQEPILGRLRYIFTIGALIDLVAVAPFFVGLAFHETFDLRFLRVFRLSRLLKLTRYTGTINTMYKAIYRERRVLFAAAFMMVLLVILTASLGYEFEHAAQPDKFDTIPDAMYWAVITLASVGYGDLIPITPMGRAMTVVISLIGIGIFAIPAGLMASAFTDQLRIDREAFENEFRDAIAKGRLSSGDRLALEAEAERLHLSMEDVERITDKVKGELMSNTGALPEGMAPEIVFEKYRQQVSHLKVFSLSRQAEHIDLMLQKNGNATELERQIWILVTQKSN